MRLTRFRHVALFADHVPDDCEGAFGIKSTTVVQILALAPGIASYVVAIVASDTSSPQLAWCAAN